MLSAAALAFGLLDCATLPRPRSAMRMVELGVVALPLAGVVAIGLAVGVLGF